MSPWLQVALSGSVGVRIQVQAPVSRVQRAHHSALQPLLDVGHPSVSDGNGVGKEGCWSPWEDGNSRNSYSY